MSAAVRDTMYPYQVIVAPSAGTGTTGALVDTFCKLHESATRPYSIVKDDEWRLVYCFQQAASAEAFIALTGGEKFDPKTRGRGARWHLLKKP